MVHLNGRYNIDIKIQIGIMKKVNFYTHLKQRTGNFFSKTKSEETQK